MKQRLPLLLFMTGLGALAWFSLSKVQFSASLYELLPRDLVEVRGMDWLNRYFGRDGQLIVTVSSPDPNLSKTAETALVKRLREESSLVATVHQEMELNQLAVKGGSLLAWLWLNAPPDQLSLLAKRLEAPQSGETISEAMNLIVDGLIDEATLVRSYDPLLLSKLPDELRSMDASEADAMTSPDKSFRLFYVEGNGVDFSDYREAAQWLDQIKSLVTEWREKTGLANSVRIGLTGTPAFMAEVGTEMEKDMTLSVMATMLLISLLFWIMHRQTEPLGWLIAVLCLVLILTLNLGGVFFGKLSVMSAGFAAILLGLAVDYGIILYREAIGGKVATTRELRARVGPAIIWAASTTAVVFLSLNFSSLPGISEMGNLVAIGIAIGAVTMLWGFSIIAIRFARDGKLSKKPAPSISSTGGTRIAMITALLIPLFAEVSILTKEMPHLEAEFHPFRIRSSPSMAAWQEMQGQLRGRENSIPMIITGDSMTGILEELDTIEARLTEARSAGDIDRFMLPTSLLPHPENQKANRVTLQKITAQQERLLGEIDQVGFSADGSLLTREVLKTWSEAVRALNDGAEYASPSGSFARWTVGRLFHDNHAVLAALGSVKPVDPTQRAWMEDVFDEHSAVAGLSSLGTALNQRISRDLKVVFLPMIALLALMLGIVFRSWKDWVLAVFSLIFAGCMMVILTLWTPLSWNSFNICGLPLLFGTGLDFGIHMIFALRRSGGNLEVVHRGVSKALLFCGTSSAIGFGSLAFASAHGLASLGQICAAGILVNMVVAVWLLPRWYRTIHGLNHVKTDQKK